MSEVDRGGEERKEGERGKGGRRRENWGKKVR